eukprot:CAMPEP_0114994264 /NCGR_PEP_ID=MMETSP0216-20121206/13024_1 /TAXON_ID=223996 /ORGANISM="Protocruzia adherens, Strain Boccale" /LENGTH=299 /DNA_ID=CAMNT_0002358069 /DNA_START=295 /DNA_END=1194 /DNA_ORIENTATION=-
MSKGTAAKAKDSMISGMLSTVTSNMLLQPLDVIKSSSIISQHGHDSQWQLFNHTVKKVYQSEGIKGFWRGLKPSMLRSAGGSGLFFYSLVPTKHYLGNFFGDGSFMTNIIASGLCRFYGLVFTNPLTVIKTRFEIVGFEEYATVTEAIKRILREEGAQGFFKGLLANTLCSGTHTAFYYAFYQNNKKLLGSYFKNENYLTLMAAYLGGVMATMVSHPMDVLRTRFQFQHFNKFANQHYSGLGNAMVRIYRVDGIRGYWVGLLPKLVKKPLGHAYVWTLYEALYSRISVPAQTNLDEEDD